MMWLITSISYSDSKFDNFKEILNYPAKYIILYLKKGDQFITICLSTKYDGKPILYLKIPWHLF